MIGQGYSIPSIVALLVILSVSLTVWAFLSARAAAHVRFKRMSRFASPIGSKSLKTRSAEEEVRRNARQIQRSSRAIKRTGLGMILKQAGIGMPTWALLLVFSSVSTGIGGVAFLMGKSPLFSIIVGIGLGPGVLALYVRRKRNKRKLAMEKDFPGALDIIVRGVKSGLPLNDCIRIASRDIRDPLGAEFAKMVEQQSLGMSIGDAVTRFAARVPLQEASFFAIVIALQTRTGGRLAESLDNLVSVLRARVQLRAKIRSMSSEAKASGMIIGALPPIVATLVYFTSPDYMGLLFSEAIGNVVLVCSALWMAIGVFVMKKMIAFDY